MTADPMTADPMTADSTTADSTTAGPLPVDLLIAGAGGFARETVSAVHAINRAISHATDGVWRSFRPLGFLDDDPALHGTGRAGLTVLGGLSDVFDHPDAMVVVCVGNPRDYSARARVVDRLALPHQRYATIVHPAASVGTGCTVGPGSVLLAGAVLTAGVTVGAHVSVMPQAVLTHDDVVEDYATIASGARLGGAVRLEPGVYLGAGALVREGVRIGAGSLIGMGAVVLHDVPPGEVWAGNPARRLRPADEKAGVFAGMTVRSS